MWDRTSSVPVLGAKWMPSSVPLPSDAPLARSPRLARARPRLLCVAAQSNSTRSRVYSVRAASVGVDGHTQGIVITHARISKAPPPIWRRATHVDKWISSLIYVSASHDVALSVSRQVVTTAERHLRQRCRKRWANRPAYARSLKRLVQYAAFLGGLHRSLVVVGARLGDVGPHVLYPSLGPSGCRHRQVRFPGRDHFPQMRRPTLPLAKARQR
jgi:hypothetical protein